MIFFYQTYIFVHSNIDQQIEQEQVVTLWYRPPELLLCGEKRGASEWGYGHEIDVWSCGCVIAEMSRYGTPLFDDFCEIGVIMKIFRFFYYLLLGVPSSKTWPEVSKLKYCQNQPWPKWNPKDLTGELDMFTNEPIAVDLVTVFITKKKKNRYILYIKRMLTINPASRPSAKALIEGHVYFKGYKRCVPLKKRYIPCNEMDRVEQETHFFCEKQFHKGYVIDLSEKEYQTCNSNTGKSHSSNDMDLTPLANGMTSNNFCSRAEMQRGIHKNRDRLKNECKHKHVSQLRKKLLFFWKQSKNEFLFDCEIVVQNSYLHRAQRKKYLEKKKSYKNSSYVEIEGDHAIHNGSKYYDVLGNR
ncbi:Protein kinase domain containing protein [Reticulomyxa filosa]|uniref:Cyclin-dependent kinase 2 homolog n=1 Tax=Reticulomyxa filosa TaxID=46433 RepID=X6M7K0_RETFI|nr:Protein kinase domain containing protein [Reticulomyxa filosa]|eukprot:ETO09958.1 Protein kinase domain containing protein [Reticulomyxa filosa]